MIDVSYSWEDLYSTLSSIADGVIRVDRKRNIVFMNKAAQKYTGWDEQDAILQPVDAVFNIIDPKTREKVECCFAEMIDSGKACFGYCPILISKSGSERYISVNVSLLNMKTGRFQVLLLPFRMFQSIFQEKPMVDIGRGCDKVQDNGRESKKVKKF